MASETKIYNENLYRVQFTANGEFMKVFMPEPNMHTNVTNEDPPAAPTEKTNKKSNQTVSAPDGDQQLPLIDETKIPETVLQFQRQLRKTQAAKRASAPLSKDQLRVIHNDEHIVVVNKPSGVLTVPGLNSNPSMLTLLHEEYRHEMVDAEMKREHMIIHRLDMDTSGIVVFAKTKAAMAALHSSFRKRHVSKFYEAVVCGHIDSNVKEGSIDMPLQRDHRCPPFMRVATPESERAAKEVVKDLNHAGWKKIVKKNAKPSQTLFEIIDREYVILSLNAAGGEGQKKRQMQQRLPVTRIKLTPITGRTHQLRVHCAAIGHPILGDPTYGVYGEASPNGGFENDDVDLLIPSRASMDLQLSLNQYVKENDQVMCLHARELRITHPHSGDAMVFQDPPAF